MARRPDYGGALSESDLAELRRFDPLEVTPKQLISGGRSLQGWSTGTSADSEDTLRFAELSGLRPMIETYPLERADEAYARMMSGKAEFRVVLRCEVGKNEKYCWCPMLPGKV